MKRIFISSLILMVIFSFTPVYAEKNTEPVVAQGTVLSVKREAVNNHVWTETIITEDVSELQNFALRSSTSTKSGTKTVNYYNGDTLLWSVTVRGTFTYGNGTSYATYAVTTVNSYSSSWTVEKTGNYYTGNTVVGSAVGKKYFLGIQIQAVSREVRLSCSPTGVLS